MAKILKKKVGGISVQDLIATGIAKPVIEIAVSPVIGNANVVSGMVKLGSALLTGHFLGRSFVPRAIAYALAVDGTEDILMGSGVTPMATGLISGRTTQGDGW